MQQVEEIALYNTTFKKLDGGVVLFSNALIASTGFSNLSRSGLHNESFKARFLNPVWSDRYGLVYEYNPVACHLSSTRGGRS